MKFKSFFLACVMTLATVVIASEFVTPKYNLNQPANLKPAKKIKELIIDKISHVVRDLLVKLDYLSINARVYLLDQLELGLCGESTTIINSSSKSQRQAYLDLLQEIEQDITNFNHNLEDKLNKLKTLNLKATKLKG